MSINLINLIKENLGSQVISQTATRLGETESGISKAISVLLPAVIGGFANSNAKSELYEVVKNAVVSGSTGSFLGDNNTIVNKVLNLIFGGGDKQAAITDSVSEFAGISNQSTHQVLELVTGTVTEKLGSYIKDNNVDISSFESILKDQKGHLYSILPVGFNMATLGFGNWFGQENDRINIPANTPVNEIPTVPVSDAPKIEVSRSGTTHEIVSSQDSGSSIWKWLLPLLILLLLGWFLWKQCNNKPEATPVVVQDSTVVEKDSANVVKDTVMTRETTLVTLPSGKTLQAYKGGIEDQIVKFLKSDEYKNSTENELKDKWFNFDNLNFEFNKAVLTPESQPQLDNLKMILVEFPDAKIKIGAYTDKKGDVNTNLKLSDERAETVKNSLNSSQVIDAEGYGSKFAKIPAEATDKERESDRKTSIRFVK